MNKNVKFYTIAPVLSSSDIERDIKWYEDKTGFKLSHKEKGYAVLNREHLWIHLQFHYGTEEDPVLGSVIKIFVEGIQTLFEEFVTKGVVTNDRLRMNTPWNTNEFGFFDLNKNAIFFVEDI